MYRILFVSYLLAILTGCSNNNSNTPTPCNSNQWSQLSVNSNGSLMSIGTNLVVANGNKTFLSADNGNTWTQILSSLISTIIAEDATGCYNTVTQYIFSDGVALYAAVNQIGQCMITLPSPSKVYKSNDNGNTWQRVWQSHQLNNINSISFLPSKIFLTSSGGNTTVSTDNGVSWSVPDSDNSFYGAANGSNVYTDGTDFYLYNGTLLKSTNNGASFETINTPSNITYSMAVIGTRLFIADSSPNGGVYISNDGGASWSLIMNGINTKYIPMTINALGLFSNGTTLYVSLKDRVFTSTNNGVSWSQLGCDIDKSLNKDENSVDYAVSRMLINNGYLFGVSGINILKINI